MSDEKRITRSYKVKNSFYLQAMKRAAAEGGALANLLESVVISYSSGLDIIVTKPQTGKGSKVKLYAGKNTDTIFIDPFGGKHKLK